MAKETKSAHIGGFYTIIAALIGLFGVWYAWHLSQKKRETNSEKDEYSELRQVVRDLDNPIVGVWKANFFDTIDNDVLRWHRTLYLKSNHTGLNESKMFVNSKDVSCTVLAPFTWKYNISDLYLTYNDTECFCSSELMSKTLIKGYEEGMSGLLNNVTEKEIFVMPFGNGGEAFSIYKGKMNIGEKSLKYQRLK